MQRLKPTQDNIEIIDLLTGMGETWHSVKNRFPNASLTALDFSGEMMKHAERKNRKHFSRKVSLIQQNVLDNNLPGEYFDVVICSFGLKTFNSEQIRHIAKQTKRILKNGGQFAFVEVSKPRNPILNFLYSFYLGNIIPILGWLLLGNPREYRMLWKYTSEFENALKAYEIFRSEGLTTTFESYFFGCASGFHGMK